MTTRRLSIESLEGRALMAMGDLRMVTYNVAALDGVPSSDLGTVLNAIGSEVYAGQVRPIDVLAIQEVRTQDTTTAQVVSQLNAIYGSPIYASGSFNGASTSSFSPDTVGLVYNTQTVQLVNELGIGTVSASGQPRQTIRYQMRLLGVSPVTDFYVYNSHFKASNTATDAARRQVEAAAIRANADTLPQGTHVIYAGDFNVYSSNEASIQTLLAPGNGQAFDPVNRLGSWSNNASFRDIFTQAPAVNPPGGLVGGGLDDRFDFLLQSDEWTDGTSLEYVLGSYRTFGNNGSVSMNDSINSVSNTALAGLANRTTILDLLTTVTDHLPVVTDFRFVATAVEQFVAYVGGTYTQSFDGLPAIGTFTLGSVGPHFLNSAPIGAQNLAGWEFSSTVGSSARFNVGSGTSTTGAVYSFGATNAADRALGSLATSTMVGAFGLNLVNSTGATLTSFTISYVGEKWREGGSNTADTLAFSYGVGVQNITTAGTGVFVASPSLDFVSSTVSTSATSVNGNTAPYRTNKVATIQGIQWLAGQRLVLRWRDTDDSGGDDGLAIDDVAFTASASASTVVARHIYYRGSTAFDTTLSSEAAIDRSKVPLTAGDANINHISTYLSGLTGIIIDVQRLSASTLSMSDFEFRIGNQSDPASWAMLPADAMLATNPIVVLPGLGVNDSTRIKLNFRENAIRRTWLQVTLKANANTGLASNDTFYFGSAPGDVVNASQTFQVTTADVTAIRQNATNVPVSASKNEDINKDGRVNQTDLSLVRQLSGSSEVLHRLQLAAPAASDLAIQGRRKNIRTWESNVASFDRFFASSIDF